MNKQTQLKTQLAGFLVLLALITAWLSSGVGLTTTTLDPQPAAVIACSGGTGSGNSCGG